MSDKTDETVQQILDIEELGYPVAEYPVWSASELGELATVSLQKLAAFWLMRKEIVDFILQANCAEHFLQRKDLLDKIKELDG